MYRLVQKNGKKFMAPYFCNHMSQSRAVFRKMFWKKFFTGQLRSIRRSVSNDVMQSLIVTGVFHSWLRLRNSCRPPEATHGQASVCAERRCMADLQSLSSGPHSAVTAQITLASDARTRFVPAGSASVSLPPRLCTWLPGFRSSARHISHLITRRRRLRSSTTSALVAPRTVRFAIGDRTFPATAASVWNSLPESVRSSPSLQVFRSKLKTELFARSY